MRFSLEIYANVDVIGDPKRTWIHQRRLESMGLRPVPVLHFPTTMDWLRRYLDQGYEYIGLGGLVGKAGTTGARRWVSRCFQEGGRGVRFHGFGVVNYKMLIRYPWYSVDSAAAIKESSRGCVFVPRWMKGMWNIAYPPYKLRVSDRPSKRRNSSSGADFVQSLSAKEREIVSGWLDEIGVMNDDGVIKEDANRYKANVLFFEWLKNKVPLEGENGDGERGFGLVG